MFLGIPYNGNKRISGLAGCILSYMFGWLHNFRCVKRLCWLITNNNTYVRCHWRGHWCVSGCHVGHSILCEWIGECNLSPGKQIMGTSLHHADYRVLFFVSVSMTIIQLLAGGGLAPHSLCHDVSHNQCTRIHVISICIFNILYIYKLFTLATSTLTPDC